MFNPLSDRSLVGWFRALSFALGFAAALLVIGLSQRLLDPKYEVWPAIYRNIPNAASILGFVFSLYVALTIGETKRKVKRQNLVSKRLDALQTSATRLNQALTNVGTDPELTRSALFALKGNVNRALTVCNEENGIEGRRLIELIDTVTEPRNQASGIRDLRESLDQFREAIREQALEDSLGL